MEIRCMKCRKNVSVDDSDIEYCVAKNGNHMAKSTCPECGSKVSKFVKKED